MARRSASSVIGIVASIRGGRAHVPRAVHAAARRNGIDLVDIDIGSLERLMPAALTQEVPAWIIAYSERDDADLLLVPYPAEFAGPAAEASSGLTLDHLFQAIRTDRNAPWSVATGYDNLVAAEKEGLLPDPVRCFQAIRLPARLRRLFRGAIPRGQNSLSESWVEGITDWAGAAGERIAAKRKALREAIDSEQVSRADEAAAEFDADLADEAAKMAEKARHDGLVQEPPLLRFLHVDNALHALEPKSRTFLETSLCVEEVAVQRFATDFDYSAAACPLWKIVELELNLSVGWLVRLLREVASRQSAWIARSDRDPRDRVEIPTGVEPHKRVELNERDSLDVNRLKGLMLGPMQYMLSFADHNGLRDEVLMQQIAGEWDRDALDRFLFARTRKSHTSVHRAIARITDLRNKHAHLAAMDRVKFDKLKDAVLGPFHDPGKSLLGNILSLKVAIQDFASRPQEIEPPGRRAAQRQAITTELTRPLDG